MLKNVAALASVIFSLMMTGCAETPNEYIELKGKYADDYELDAEDFSEPTRFLYPLKWIEPKRTTNNLDVFYYDVDKKLEDLLAFSGERFVSLLQRESKLELTFQD
ncbi:hypothetical protein [Vibrio cholerae]|uniref:hypothetical protein n=1 Tax=Vibrio cholerae TaxID=666 RepID=UPI0015829D97|nr:hypothetical protein [Vibrio cholerae]EJL6462616.1 hypothetical protein [Vibrio cholerae]MBJ6954123.1 hypothetical protein [Vibrio cholerae]HDZ9329296.1 hypothetical protein [Vibrio cholerae]